MSSPPKTLSTTSNDGPPKEQIPNPLSVHEILLLGAYLQQQSAFSGQEIQDLWAAVRGHELSQGLAVSYLSSQLHLKSQLVTSVGWRRALAEKLMDSHRHLLVERLRFLNLESRSLQEVESLLAQQLKRVKQLQEVVQQIRGKSVQEPTGSA